MTLRVLWTYEHPTARFQEMMLFPEAGIEVVPTFTRLQTGWLDSGYHDESHPMYPPWRNYCSLPVNVVERIRRSRLWERNFKIDKDEAALINKHFSAIFVNCSSQTLANIFEWYRGKILFRCNGGPNRDVLMSDARAWVETARQAGRTRDFIFLPSLHKLIVPEMAENCIRRILFPVYVDEERVPGEWARRSSRTIATAISYVDFHKHFQAQLAEMARAYRGAPLTLEVFGKNKVIDTAAENVRVIGGLPKHEEFWARIFDCVAFVDAGQDPTHNIFPPLEAAFKGMPVFWCKDNGNVQAIADSLPQVKLDADIGVLPTHDDIAEHLPRVCEDAEKLAHVNRTQLALLRDIFSRENALTACFQIREELVTPMQRLMGKTPDPLVNKVRHQTGSLKHLLAPELGKAAVDFARLTVRNGDPDWKTGSVFCPPQRGPITEREVLTDYLPELAPGAYEIIVRYSGGGWPAHVGRVETGRWAHGTDWQAHAKPMAAALGKTSVRIVVDETTRHWTHELRISAFSNVGVRFRSIELRPIAPT
jgi:hypothetical protein